MADAPRKKHGNPAGNPENLKSFGKDKPPLTSEQAREYGRRGAKKTNNKKRQQITLDKAFYNVMNKAVNGDLKKELKKAGFEEDELNNANALLMRMFQLAIDGDKDLMKLVVNYQQSLVEDARKSEESKARIESMSANTGAPVTVQSNDENNGGVVIYLPALEEDEPEELEEEATIEATPVEEG